MPHKVAILPHLDGLTEEGRQVGACNTVFVQEAVDASSGKTTKKYIGTNTDVIGVRDALLHAVEDPASVSCVICSLLLRRSNPRSIEEWHR